MILYLSRCAEILLELETKNDALDVNMQLQLNEAETKSYNCLKEALRVRITRGKTNKNKNTTINFKLISGFHLNAGFQAEIRAGLVCLVHFQE